MTISNEIIIPIIQLIAYVVLGCWILYMIYWVFKKIFPNFKWILKYKLLGGKYKEEDVQWCMDAIGNNMTAIDIKKVLLLKGRQLKVNEMLFIFDQISKKLKGGV